MPRDIRDLKDALESVINHAQAADDHADTLADQLDSLESTVMSIQDDKVTLQRDVEALQQANKELGEENAQLRRDAQNFDRAAAELRGLVGMGEVKLAGRDRELRRLENKLALLEEQRDGDRQALRIGRLFVQMLKISQLGGRDFIMACQDAVDHADGDDLEPVVPIAEVVRRANAFRPAGPSDEPSDDLRGALEEGQP